MVGVLGGAALGGAMTLGMCMEAGLDDDEERSDGGGSQGFDTCSWAPPLLVIGGAVVAGTLGALPGRLIISADPGPDLSELIDQSNQ